jgi:hypothetical protein
MAFASLTIFLVSVLPLKSQTKPGIGASQPVKGATRRRRRLKPLTGCQPMLFGFRLLGVALKRNNLSILITATL